MRTSLTCNPIAALAACLLAVPFLAYADNPLPCFDTYTCCLKNHPGHPELCGGTPNLPLQPAPTPTPKPVAPIPPVAPLPRVELPLKPPGDCTTEEHNALKAAVGTHCKSVSMVCLEQQSCAQLIENWRRFQRCISARKEVTNRCFRGGDERHVREVERYELGALDCLRILREKQDPPCRPPVRGW